jgi:hypothetical protein
MRDRAYELDWTPDVEPPEPLRDVESDTSWLRALAASAAGGDALWCDDLGTVQLARQLGIPAFGTIALFNVLAARSIVSEKERAEAALALFRARAVDLPASRDTLVGLAELCDWAPAPSLAPVARPAMWMDLNAGLAATVAIARGLTGAGNDNLGDVALMAMIGVVRTYNDAIRFGSAVLAGLALNLNAEPAQAAQLVAGARFACATHDLGDPLAAITEAIFELRLTKARDRGEAVADTSRILSGLSSADMTTVTTTLLGLKPRRGSARDVVRDPTRQPPPAPEPPRDEP